MERPDGARELAEAGYAWEIGDAPILHDGLNLADLAHALELRDLGLLPSDRLIAGLVRLCDMDPGEVGYSPELGEAYTSREHRLRSMIGDDAGRLHLGRTRREAVRTAFRIAMRRRLGALLEVTAGLGEALGARAVREAETAMPDYTYLQPAQPTTLGHYLLSFADPLLRDAGRLLADLADVDASLAGAGAANGSTVPIDRERMAARLGFGASIEHLRDAMWQTDPFLHASLDATSLVLTQDRLAEDLEILASREFGFVALGDGLVRPSVLMPQKRNPYALSVVRGSAAVLIGRSTSQLALSKSPSARSDALIYAYGEVPRALDLAIRVTALMAAVVRTLEVDPQRMREALSATGVEATDVATMLTGRWGIDYATAHDIVADAMRSSGSSGSSGSIDADALATAAAARLGTAVEADPSLLTGLDASAVLSRRTVAGGPSAAEVGRMAVARDAEWSRIRSLASRARDRWSAAERALADEARLIAQRHDTTQRDDTAKRMESP